jgi:hypothetical protein
MLENDEPLAAKQTVYTLQINAKIPLKLVFNLTHFKE